MILQFTRVAADDKSWNQVKTVLALDDRVMYARAIKDPMNATHK